VGLSAKERHENVRDAFTANPRLVNGKVVLILDDVTTTGATLQNCSNALLQAGAIMVYGLTLAKAVLREDALDLSEAALPEA
jgi:predicted amidophosphoribosyltransferase